MKIFSFCIYGTENKYYFGLEENLRIINEFYPDYQIYIFCGSNQLTDILNKLSTQYLNVNLINTNKEGVINMTYRYMPITYENVESVIIRDADSEINPRDRWCIDDFANTVNSKEQCNMPFVQIIRDHFWHKSRIMGGLFNIQCVATNSCATSDTCHSANITLLKAEFTAIFKEIEEGLHTSYYGFDEQILSKRIYPIIQNNTIVYSNICVHEGETFKPILYENTGTNFCGNVIEYTKSQDSTSIQESHNYSKSFRFNYFDYNVLTQLQWLLSQKQYGLMISIIDEYKFQNINPCYHSQVIEYLIIANIHNAYIDKCIELYGTFYEYAITDKIRNTVPEFFEMIRSNNYTIVGTCDVTYIPKPNEFCIYYGTYPDDYMALPQSRQIYRHFILKSSIVVDRFECADCWKSIDRIFIMGLENEYERMNDTIMHLTFMNAPLDRIEEYRAKKDVELTDVYIGATKNHLDCLKRMIDGSYSTCLFLEDDFVFSSNIKKNQDKLTQFFKRQYEYNICFLSASKYHNRLKLDDLLIVSKQSCTTSSGYLINSKNVGIVYETVKDGYEKLIETKNSNLYCIDRYWTKLDNIFIFKQKIGFQKPSRSKITGQLNIELD